MKITIFSALFCAAASLSAQSTALIMGEVQADAVGYLRILGDTRYVDTREFAQTALINETTGRFALVVPLQGLQTLQLEYAGKRTEIFLQPQDTLYIRFHAGEYPRLRFDSEKGAIRAAAANDCWQQYKTLYAPSVDPMSLRQYRRGAYYFPLTHDEDRRMQTMPPDSFTTTLRRERYTQEQWAKSHSAHASAEFRSYLYTDIQARYLWAYLAYGQVYKGRWRLDAANFLAPLDSQAAALWSDSHIHNAEYRRFALAYTHWQSERTPQDSTRSNEYARWYGSAQQALDSAQAPITRYATLAAILAQGLQRSDGRELNDEYRNFLKTNPYVELDYIIGEATQRTQRLAAGTAAPNFTLQDFAGQEWALSDLRGKIVYVDFWASWCRPCVEKMQKMRTWQTQWAGENIIFLHINLDDEERIWRENIEKHQLQDAGVQLYHPPTRLTAAEYQIEALPKFFLIAADGNFAFSPTSGDMEALAESIRKLLKK